MSDKKLVIKLKYGASAHHAKVSPTLSRPPEYEWNYRRIALVFSMAVIVLGLLAYVLLKSDPEGGNTEPAVQGEIPAKNNQQPAQATVSSSPRTDGRIQSLSSDGKSQLNESPESRRNEIELSSGETHPKQKTALRDKIASDEAKSEPGSVDVQRLSEPAKGDLPIKVERAYFSWGIKDNEPTGKISSPAILQPGDSVPLYFYSEIRDLQGKNISHVWSRNGKVTATRNFHAGEGLWHGFSSIQLNSKLLGRWRVTIRNSEGRNLGDFDLEVLEPAKSSN